MSGTTRIKGADWVIAWDEVAERHVFPRGADEAFPLSLPMAG